MKGQTEGCTARQENESAFALKGTKAKALITVCSSFEMNKSFGEAVGRCISLYMLDRYATFVYLKLFKGVAITFPFSSRITAQLFEAVELAEEFFLPPPSRPLSFSQSPSPPIGPLPTPALSPPPLNLPPTTDSVNPKESESSINNVKITQTENKMKELIIVNVLYKNNRQKLTLREEKTAVAICPDFTIDPNGLKLSPKKSLGHLSIDQILACAEQIPAKNIYFLYGYALLYLDYLFLDSLCTADSPDLVKTEKDQKFLGSSENPKAEHWKSQVKKEEKQRLQEATKEIESRNLKFICSSDLLDTPEGEKLFQRLKDYVSNKSGKSGKQLSWVLDGLRDKFIQKHYADILKRKDLVYKYNSRIPVETVLKAYMDEYFLREYSEIFVKLAFEGFTTVLSDASGAHFRAMQLVIEFFSTPILSSSPPVPFLSEDQKMESLKIEFKIRPSSSLQGSPQNVKSSAPPPLLPDKKFELGLAAADPSEVKMEEVCTVIATIMNTNVSPSTKLFFVHAAISGMSISPPQGENKAGNPSNPPLNASVRFGFPPSQRDGVFPIVGVNLQA